MTATAIQAAISCPVCGGEMYDNRGTKKNPKQPDFKCKRYKEGCEGVIWPPKAPKAAPKASGSFQSKPNAELPPYLQNQEAEDAAALAAKIAPEKPKMRETYEALTNWVISNIVPLYVKADIGCSDTAVAAMVATLYISAVNRGKVE